MKMDLPLMGVDELGLGGVFGEVADEGAGFGDGPAGDAADM